MTETIDGFYRAMQRGPEGLDELVDLFAEDAVYVEPFSGGTHNGRAEIRAFLEQSQGRLPDLRITVDKVDVEGDTVATEWTCESSAFTKPSRGRDRFTIRGDEIVRLETTITEPPQLRSEG
jgi:ketosteroid isomerase-like protein